MRTVKLDKKRINKLLHFLNDKKHQPSGSTGGNTNKIGMKQNGVMVLEASKMEALNWLQPFLGFF